MRWLSALLILLLVGTVCAQSGESFVLGNVNDNEVYVGEPLIYTLRIHLVGEGADPQVIPPNLVGFGHSSLQIEPSVATEVFGSDLYTIIEQNYLFFPLRVGTLTIEPFQVQVPPSPFHDGVTISTEPMNVTVMALPPNVPEGFRNAIGQYEIEASASPIELRSGDALTLNVSISGTGNIEQILAPEIMLPEGWRVFDGESNFEQDGLLFGQKSFSWTIFPVGEGAVEIPSIVFSYFNPQSDSYETRRTAPIPLTLSAGQALAAPEIPDREASLAPEIPLMSPHFGLAPYPPLWFWVVWFVPPVFALGIWLLRRPRIIKAAPEPQKLSSSRAMQNFRRQLKAAQSLAPKAAYAQIENALNSYLSARNIDLNKLAAPLKTEMQACLEEASTGRYAPIAEADVIELLRRSLAAVSAIEKGKA